MQTVGIIKEFFIGKNGLVFCILKVGGKMKLRRATQRKRKTGMKPQIKDNNRSRREEMFLKALQFPQHNTHCIDKLFLILKSPVMFCFLYFKIVLHSVFANILNFLGTLYLVSFCLSSFLPFWHYQIPFPHINTSWLPAICLLSPPGKKNQKNK